MAETQMVLEVLFDHLEEVADKDHQGYGNQQIQDDIARVLELLDSSLSRLIR